MSQIDIDMRRYSNIPPGEIIEENKPTEETKQNFHEPSMN